MDIPVSVPPDRRALLEQLALELSRVEGVRAVVLGGSYARGSQHAGSDLDVGIYYFERVPFEIDAIRRIAGKIALEPPTVTDFYAWGPWVNGGAWIHTPAGKVDFIYRNLDQVGRTLDEAEEGITQHDYDQQPAFGFYSVIYLAETQVCRPLYDPDSLIVGLKRRVEHYPPKLKEKIVSDALWSAEFGLIHARGFAATGDVYATAGCLVRIASNLTQGLYAINEVYFTGDKKAIAALAAFPILPPAFVARLNQLLARVGSTPAELGASVSSMEQLWRSVVAVVGEGYQSRYQL
jgi:hypothetical protein